MKVNGQRQQYPKQQWKSTERLSDKLMYDIRDNVVTLYNGQVRLARSIKTMLGHIKDISDMLEDTERISRTRRKRESSFSHGDGSNKPAKVLQDSGSSDENTGLRKDKDKRRCRVVDIHEQGKEVHGGVFGKTSSDNVKRIEYVSDSDQAPSSCPK